MIKTRSGTLKSKSGRYVGLLRTGEIKFDTVIASRPSKKQVCNRLSITLLSVYDLVEPNL